MEVWSWPSHPQTVKYRYRTMRVYENHQVTINYRIPKAIAFVENTSVNITANKFYKFKKELSISEVFARDLFNLSSVGYISGIYLANSGLSIVNMSSRYRGASLNLSMRSNRLDFRNFVVKSLSLQNENKSVISGIQFVPIGPSPTFCSGRCRSVINIICRGHSVNKLHNITLLVIFMSILIMTKLVE